MSSVPRPSDLAYRHLAKVVESSDDAIVSKDLDGTITSWNQAAERLFGYTAHEAVGQSIRMIIPQDRQSEEDEVLARIRSGQAVTHYETIRQHKNGSQFPISLTVSPIRDDSGQVVGASKIARDISQRQAADRAIREHAENAQKLGEVGIAVASTLDREVIAQQVIDAAVNLTRAAVGAFVYHAQDPANGSVCTLSAVSGAPQESRVTVSHPRIGEWTAAGSDKRGVVRLDDVTKHPRHGTESPFTAMPPGLMPIRSYLAVPVKGRGGDVLGGLFFGHPEPGRFTEQHEHLAAGIAGWASLSLENAHLFIEAQNANRMKDEFLAVLSHELRTPLNAIVGYSRLLRGGLLTADKAERALETLDRNAAWLAQIVDDVLDVSRIVSGKIRLDVQEVELSPILGNAVATVQPAADAKGVRLWTSLDPGASPVSGDPDRLQQIVWNLLSNAVKFTPKGGRVDVRLESGDAFVEIVVSDTGDGIRADFLPYVFDRFRQAESGMTRRNGGLGLGLAIVRHLTEMHGGTVSAESAGEGRGATFRVRLPVLRHQVERPERRHEPARRPMAPLPALGGLEGVRVLAIDDDPDVLALVRVVLESAGAVVTTFGALSPDTLIDRIDAVAPDVLVVDLSMPDIDGFEVIARIRSCENPRVRAIPATALTALARAEDRTRALRSGFELHLAKPIDPGELVVSVSSLLRRTRATT